MNSAVNVKLPPELKKWVEEQVRQGGFEDAGEFVRHMLRRSRDRQVRRRIDGLLVEAVESGATAALDEAEWASIRKEARACVKRRGRK